MALSEEQEFHDPGLKAALKRTCGAETAPLALHMSVAAAMQELPGGSVARSAAAKRTEGNIFTRPLGWRSLAAAAAMVVVGIGAATYYTFHEPEVYFERGAARAVISDTLIEAILKEHDADAADPMKHPALATVAEKNDLGKVKEQLVEKLGRPVWVADLRTDGWQFRGASVCEIEHVEAANVVFTKGSDTVSLLSMPSRDTCGGTLMEDYDSWVNNHAVIAFSAKGQLFCLVASSPQGQLKMADAQKLIERFRKDALACGQRDAHTSYVLGEVAPTR